MSKELHQIYKILNTAVSNPSSNLICSPFNIASCLSMVADGVTGTTKQELVNFFGFAPAANTSSMSLQEPVRTTFKEALTGSAASGGAGSKTKNDKPTLGDMVKTAQALFVTKDIKDSYIAEIAKNYRALVKSINPADCDAAIAEVNAFVARSTENKIVDIMPPKSIDKSTSAVLVAALYFKGSWNTPFKTANTSEKPFFLPTGKIKEVPMMQGSIPSISLIESKSSESEKFEDIVTAAIPYKGFDLLFVVEAFLPDSNKTTLPPSDFNRVIRAAQGPASSHTKTEVTLPKFKIATAISNLPEILKANGVNAPFTVSDDFNPMSDVPLFISALIHKAIIEVDEEGTVAAAATVATLSRCSAPAPPKNLTIDRPFHFHIVHKRNGTILFSGSVSDPSA